MSVKISIFDFIFLCLYTLGVNQSINIDYMNYLYSTETLWIFILTHFLPFEILPIIFNLILNQLYYFN